MEHLTTDINLTLESLLNYTNSQGERDKMKGQIRPAARHRKCPKCNKTFTLIVKVGFLCPSCHTVPKRLYIDLHWQGKRPQVYSDKFGQPLDSYHRASVLLSHIQYEIDSHTFDPTRYVAADVQSFYFQTLSEKWIQTKEKEGRSPSYLPKLKQYNRDYFVFFKNKDVRDIRTRTVSDFYHGLPEHLKPKTQKNIVDALSGFFNWLEQLEYIEKAPKFPKITVDEPDWKWLDLEVQEKVLSAIPEDDRPIFVFLALHGTRPSEGRGLKVKDIDFQHGAITIRRTFTGKSGNLLLERTKSKKNRTIPLNPEMKDILKRICSDKLPESFVFLNPRTGREYSKSTYQEIWDKARKSAGIDIKSYEGLRHSFASQRVSRGGDLYLMSKLLGHSDLRVTQKYAHTNIDSLKIAMEVPRVVEFKKSRKK